MKESQTLNLGPVSYTHLPALFPNDSKLDYHNLDMVQNGQMAMDAFKKMNSLTEEDLK